MSRYLLAIPCFRERTRLPAFLTELSREIEASRLSIAVCIVDDGSGPEDARWLRDYVDSLRPTRPWLLPALLSPTNLGKGGAIYLAWNQHRSTDWVAFADADGATSAREILRVLKSIDDDPAPVPAYFASRIKMLGRRVERKLTRHITGRVFTTVASNLLDLTVYDSQCGFKILRRFAYEAAAPHLREQRFCFDVDLLIQLQRNGHAVHEVPVDWVDKDGSKVSLVRDSLAMFVSLLKLRRVIKQAKR